MSQSVEVTLGNTSVQVLIEGGNIGVGASVLLSDLNSSVVAAETAADEAEAALAAIPPLLTNKANLALDNVDEAVFGGKGFEVASRPVAAPLVARFANVIDLSADYGVVADGATANQQVLINQAIAESLAASNPLRLRLPPGQIRINAALSPLTKSIVLEGDTERATQLRPVGNFNAVTIGTGASRTPDAGLRNVGFNAADMTGGHCVVVDWTQNVILDNVLIADPWSGISVRQSGGVALNRVTIDGVRGDYAFKAIGPGGTRNGETDKIDALSFSDVLMQSTYIPGGPVPTQRLLEVDGWVHTIQFFNTRLLSALSGLRTLNTYGLDQKFAPSFIYGVLETENTYERGMHFLAANDIHLWKAFTSSSSTESGVEIGANVRGAHMALTSLSNNKFGYYANAGAANLSLSEPIIELNNGALAGLAGIEDASGNLRVYGGRSGGGVSETQAYGIKGVAGTKAFDVDLRSNVTGPIDGTVYARDCLPATPIAPATITVGASPFTYTAGSRPETITIDGGTVSLVSVQGIPVFTTTGVTVTLQPGQGVTVTYSSVPTLRSIFS